MSEISLSTLDVPTRDAIEAFKALDNLVARVDYGHFVQNTLGFGAVHVMRDPRTQQHLDRVGKIVADWYQNRAQQKFARRIMDFRPREVGKSLTVTQSLPAFAHIHDTDFEKLAKKFSGVVKQVWEGESEISRLVDTFGPFKPTNTRARQWRDDAMVTARRENLAHADPTLAAYSLAQGPTGGHFDIVILDDPVTEERMERDARYLEKVWAAYNRLPFVVNRDGLLYMIGTRYHESDLVGMIIKQEIEPRVRNMCGGSLPPDFDYDRGWIKYAYVAGWEVFYDSVYDDYDAAEKRGTVVYPVCWPHERIEDTRKSEAGEGFFWYQLMNKPAAREDAPVQRHHIDRLFVPTLRDVPERAFRTIDIHCDFAFKDPEAYMRRSGDWGVAHVCAKAGGYVYRIGGFRDKVPQDVFGDKLMKLVEWVAMEFKAKIRYITYEQEAGHGSGSESTRLWLSQLMRQNPDLPRFTPYPIKRYKGGSGKTKLGRIMQANWAWQEGYVVLVEEVDGNDPLIHQVMNQGFTEHDDDIDAFVDAFHEDLYKKTTAQDIPADITQFQPGSEVWNPQPKVFGHFDRFTGKFVAERRTARNPGAQVDNAFTRAAFGRNR